MNDTIIIKETIIVPLWYASYIREIFLDYRTRKYRIENLFILFFDVFTRVIFFSFEYATTYQINFEHSRENDTIETFNNNSLFNLYHISWSTQSYQ